jgi:hypothetical protein
VTSIHCTLRNNIGQNTAGLTAVSLRLMPTEEIVETAPMEESKVFLAKDGQYYRTYMEQRAANIRHNEAKLKAVGLDASFRRCMRNGTASPKRRKPMSPQVDEPRRQSSRIRRQPPPLELELPPSPPRPRISRKQRIPRRKEVEDDAFNTALTNKDRQQLQRYVSADWLQEMEVYLKEVEHVSYPNQRSVMRQVEKLVSGEGITYVHWNNPSGNGEIYFGRGRNVSLSDDFDQLYDEACVFEEEHGRDLGNGTYLVFVKIFIDDG